MSQICTDCGIELQRPFQKHANYVVADRHISEKETEVVYAMRHTADTHRRVKRLAAQTGRDEQAIAAEAASPNAPGTVRIPNGKKIIKSDDGSVETATFKDIDFSIPVDSFDHVEVRDPNVVQRDRAVAFTYSKVEKRSFQSAELVCTDCTEPDDSIIWGVDK